MGNTSPQKIEELIKKINWLHLSFKKSDYQEISALEKSLLKEKLIQLYDEVENIKTQKAVSKPIIKVEEKKIKAKEIEQKSIEKASVEVAKPSATIEKEANTEVSLPTKDLPKEEKKEEQKKRSFEKVEALHQQVAKPKRDMRVIIDLNKSFIFKAELFEQNNTLYNQFIEQINATRTEENAQMVLNNWTMKMNWNIEENKAFDLLSKSVEKRFLPLI